MRFRAILFLTFMLLIAAPVNGQRSGTKEQERDEKKPKPSLYTPGTIVSSLGAVTIGMYAFGWEEDEDGNQEFGLKRPGLLAVGVGLVVAGIAIDTAGRKVELQAFPNGAAVRVTF